MVKRLRSVGVFHEKYDTVVRIMRHGEIGDLLHTTEVVNPANILLLIGVINDMMKRDRARVALLTHGYVVIERP